MNAKRFSTQIDEAILEELKAYVKSSDRSISSVVNEAVFEYLQKFKIRPNLKSAMDKTINDHTDLLRRLSDKK